MDFVSYIGSVVHITVLDGFFWVGKIIEADEAFLKLIDKNGKKVAIRNEAVATIREVSNG